MSDDEVYSVLFAVSARALVSDLGERASHEPIYWDAALFFSEYRLPQGKGALGSPGRGEGVTTFLGGLRNLEERLAPRCVLDT